MVVVMWVLLHVVLRLACGVFSRQQRHDLGRCDGSEDIKPMDHDIIDVDQLQDYSCTGVVDPLHQHKHYVMPDYSVGVGKDYVIGTTADVIRLNSTAGFDTEYPTESRDRSQQQQQQQAVASMQRVTVPTPPRIHYHVYESPQMT